jgi:hypothetical protein
METDLTTLRILWNQILEYSNEKKFYFQGFAYQGKLEPSWKFWKRPRTNKYYYWLQSVIGLIKNKTSDELVAHTANLLLHFGYACLNPRLPEKKMKLANMIELILKNKTN